MPATDRNNIGLPLSHKNWMLSAAVICVIVVGGKEVISLDFCLRTHHSSRLPESRIIHLRCFVVE